MITLNIFRLGNIWTFEFAHPSHTGLMCSDPLEGLFSVEHFLQIYWLRNWATNRARRTWAAISMCFIIRNRPLFIWVKWLMKRSTLTILVNTRLLCPPPIRYETVSCVTRILVLSHCIKRISKIRLSFHAALSPQLHLLRRSEARFANKPSIESITRELIAVFLQFDLIRPCEIVCVILTVR